MPSTKLVHLPVRIPQSLKEKFRDTCEERGISQGMAARMALTAWINAEPDRLVEIDAENGFSEAVGHMATAAQALTALARLAKK